MNNYDIRLGIYLLPSWQLAKELQIIRLVLKDQFGISAALRFMTHMTVKGFFLPDEKLSFDSLAGAVGSVIKSTKPFKLHQTGFRIDNVGCYLWFNPEYNREVMQFHREIIKAVKPCISSGCDFSFSEDINDNYNPHITLAMTDIPDELKNDVISFLNTINLEKKLYDPGVCRLFEFTCSDWQKKNSGWIDTLEWKILKSWNIK